MTYGLLSPRVDFVFKKIFGNKKHPKVLISFLNAVMKPKEPIVDVKILNSDIEKEHIEDKYSRLDIRATTNLGEQIDEDERIAYNRRKMAIADRVSDLENAEKKGEERGEKRGEEKAKLELAKNLLDILDNETIALKTGLNIGIIENLRN